MLRILAEVLHVGDDGPQDAVVVEAGVLVEILVFRRDEGVLDLVRDGLDRQVEAALVGVFGHQLAVGGMHPRHHGRLVLGQRLVVGQIVSQARNVPAHPCSNGQKEHCTDPE